MNYLKNHCWCSESYHTDKLWNCQIIVSLTSYKEEDKEDWDSIIFYDQVLDLKELKRIKNSTLFRNFSEDKLENMATTEVPNLKPEVVDWLNTNVKDNTSSDHPKSWAIGNTNYRMRDSRQGMSIFFQRRRDAMAFIREFSKWKKPVSYTQYFTDVRKKLDLKTLKYKEC